MCLPDNLVKRSILSKPPPLSYGLFESIDSIGSIDSIDCIDCISAHAEGFLKAVGRKPSGEGSIVHRTACAVPL